MTGFSILAASHVGPEGYGNDLTGLRSWPPEATAALQRGDFDALRGSMLFASESLRFARMDLMSRLGLLAAELLDAGIDRLPADLRDRVGVLVETRAGCLATDLQFLRTPRPSVFAYTLPSTVLGEVCIRYRLRGPVLCLLAPDEERRYAIQEATDWLQAGDAHTCLCLSVEAIDPATAETLPVLHPAIPKRWHAAALMIGSGEGARRRHPMVAGSVEEIAGRLCFDQGGRSF
jgi:3-oxoacyl-(acyl-carrier-protein) synthase